MGRGRRPGHFQDALRFLLRAWRAEEGLSAEMGEYLVGLASVAVAEADEMDLGPFDRMLASDVLRLHRASVEGGPDALTRCRLVASQERALSKLGFRRTRIRMVGGRQAPPRKQPPMRESQPRQETPMRPTPSWRSPGGGGEDGIEQHAAGDPADDVND